MHKTVDSCSQTKLAHGVIGLRSISSSQHRIIDKVYRVSHPKDMIDEKATECASKSHNHNP